MQEVEHRLPRNAAFMEQFKRETSCTMQEYKNHIVVPEKPIALAALFASSKKHGMNFIHWLNQTGKKAFQVSKSDLDKQFSQEIEYCVNNGLVIRDVSALEKHLKGGSERYESAKIVFPLEDFSMEGYTLKAKYKAIFTHKDGTEEKTTNTLEAKFNQDWKVSRCIQSFNPPLAKVHEMAFEKTAAMS
jgi:hypothetical protein